MPNIELLNGELEPFSHEHLERHLNRLTDGLDLAFVDTALIAQKVFAGIYDGVDMVTFEGLISETIAYMSVKHPDYSFLAGRFRLASMYRKTQDKFSEAWKELYNHKNPIIGTPAPLVSEECWKLSQKYADRLDGAIVHSRDMSFDYFGLKTLEHSYLLKRSNGQVIERPQHMFMRTALGIHYDDIDAVIETYELLSKGVFTHASPTLFNAGTPNNQMSSCFLVQTEDDSIDGIYKTLHKSAMISKTAGGLGIAVHDVRATGSYVAGTNGSSNGLVPMLRVFNDTARYVDQGGGKRKGAFAIYLEPWHPDLEAFLDLRLNNGKEEARARDLFYALWVPDLFMQRCKDNGVWSFFCPKEAPGLSRVWGTQFEELYTRYEREGRARKTMRAREVLEMITCAETETGNPFILYKDACNRKSNQQNLGTIQSSNLCTEIIEFTSPDEVAVCNLASIALPKYVDVERKTYDHEMLRKVVKVVARNLNKIIDKNYYPVEGAKRSNMRHRPMGIGVQGLQDTFALLRLPFDCDEARTLNKEIAETIYFAALEASCELAETEGPYESYLWNGGCPVSKGILQFDMWSAKGEPFEGVDLVEGSRWDWSGLRQRISAYGIRNSLLIANMPTASTSQILGNNECTEPFTSNIYSRRVLSGEFPLVNRHLVRELTTLGMWNDHMRNLIIYHKGSIQSIKAIPQEIRDIYRTVWEIKPSRLLLMNQERGVFVDQAQSMTLYVKDADEYKLTSLHMKSWSMGLKNGIYYLRTQPAVDAIPFTLDMLLVREAQAMFLDEVQEEQEPVIETEQEIVCVLRRPGMPVDEECLVCGS